MIRYVGGKTRLAVELSAAIYGHKTDTHQYYYEPFFGGGSMAQYTKYFGLTRIANDIHTDLILFYRMLQVGWIPPKEISESLYNTLKTAKPSALRGYVGFSCSFGGKWFGGYARDKKGNRRLDHESYKRLLAHIPDLDGIMFHNRDYRLMFPITNECLIYCDPPYANTLGYKDAFDSVSFWNTMRQWSNNGAAVLISEYEAPSDFEIRWEKPYKTYGITLGKTKDKIERLFKWRG